VTKLDLAVLDAARALLRAMPSGGLLTPQDFATPAWLAHDRWCRDKGARNARRFIALAKAETKGRADGLPPP
jgi:hypothetical protein